MAYFLIDHTTDVPYDSYSWGATREVHMSPSDISEILDAQVQYQVIERIFALVVIAGTGMIGYRLLRRIHRFWSR